MRRSTVPQGITMTHKTLVLLERTDPAIQVPAGLPSQLSLVHRAIGEDIQTSCRQVAGVTCAFQPEGEPLTQPAIHLAAGAGALLDVEGIRTLIALLADNPTAHLALPITDRVFIQGREIPRTAGTCFTVQSGADLLALGLHPNLGEETRRILEGFHLPFERLRAALSALTDRDAEIALFGPISPASWHYLEDQVACRVRVFSSSMGEQDDFVRTVYRQVRPATFLQWLSEIADVVFLDSRALLAGASPSPTAEDYFQSDLGNAQAIAHPELHTLTELALSAPIPIILGGPTLLDGTLYAMVEAAWHLGPDVDRGYHILW